jgi:hypothetical protein
VRREKPETDLDVVRYSDVLETSAQKLAMLAQAVHDLGRLGPAAMQQGATILDACEAEIRRLANRSSDRKDERR